MRLPAGLLTIVVAGAVFAVAVPAQDSSDQSSPGSVAGDGSRTGVTGGYQLGPVIAEMLVPIVVGLIESTRDAALERGAEALPAQIRTALAGFVPPELLDRVRWRVDDGLLASLERLLGAGYVSAVTLEHVVLFANTDDAQDPMLWAHEIFHVMQYDEWGIEGFAARYLADHASVEDAAWDFRWRWVEATRSLRPAERRSSVQP